MNYTNYIFSIRLRDLRAKNNVSQKELADLLCVTQSLISAYERGAKMPTYEIIWGIADIFNVSIEYLIGRIDEKAPSNNYEKLLGNSIERLKNKLWDRNIEGIGIKIKNETIEMMLNIREHLQYQLANNKNTSTD